MAATYPLPRSSFKLLRFILIGYLHAGGNDRKPAALTDVGRTVGLDTTLVSRNNAALAALGLLESAGGRRWRLTEGGVTVARALEYEALDDAREALADLLRSNDFVQGVVAFVRGRGGVSEDQIVSHMARAAGVKKTSEFLTGARAILELMYLAGLVELEGDTVQVPPPPRDRAAAVPTTADMLTTDPWSRERAERTERGRFLLGTDVSRPAQVTLHVNITPADLKTDTAADELAARIKRLLDALAPG